MNNDTLHRSGDLWTLRFVRRLAHPPEKVWRALTDPAELSRWYPLTVTDLELRVGGVIRFREDDGGQVTAEITTLSEPTEFAFREYENGGDVHDLRFVLERDSDGCLLVFTHTFGDRDWAAHTAAGWHRCLVALDAVVAGDEVVWPDEGEQLRRSYAEQFGPA